MSLSSVDMFEAGYDAAHAGVLAGYAELDAERAFAFARFMRIFRRLAAVFGTAGHGASAGAADGSVGPSGDAFPAALPLEAIVGCVGRDGRRRPTDFSGRGLLPLWRRLWIAYDRDELPPLPVRRLGGAWFVDGDPVFLVALEVLRAKGVDCAAVRRSDRAPSWRIEERRAADGANRGDAASASGAEAGATAAPCPHEAA
jgi:hypothetical protein